MPAAVSNSPVQDTRFKTFGVLPEMQQSKGSTLTSIVIMSTVVALVILIGSQAKKIVEGNKITKLEAPIPVKEVKPKEPPKPKPVPKPLPKPPKIDMPKPKIDLPKIEVPEPPKIQPPVMKAAPVPIIQTPPAMKVTPPPAPVQIALNKPQAASIANNSPHPTAIRAGSMTNPINNTSGPAVSKINLGNSGAPGMPPGNTGLGPASKINIGGSGAPNGQMGGTGRGPVTIGVKNGVPGGSGTKGPTAGAIAIAAQPKAIVPQAPPPPAAAAKTAPKVLYKPKPEYTAEAKSLNLQGVVTVRIRVSASGAVSVLGVVGSGLGHGLNEAAIRAVQQMRFQPATSGGQPTDWEGTVNITFQLAS